MTLVDSHCHLDFEALSEDLDGVLARATEAGVERMVTICTRVREFERVRGIAERFDNIYCTVGLHPHHAAEEPELDCDALVARAGHDKVVGIGETGLDFFYDNSPRAVQEEKFLCHIEACRRTGLPLVVHTRDADAEMATILEREMAAGAFTGVLHCFSSGPELAARAVALGFYVSLSGIVTFKKADELREIVRTVPLERILVETDAPYLAPVPYRGKTNEPAFVVHTAAQVAALKQVEPETLARETTANFERLFTRAAVAGAG